MKKNKLSSQKRMEKLGRKKVALIVWGLLSLNFFTGILFHRVPGYDFFDCIWAILGSLTLFVFLGEYAYFWVFRSAKPVKIKDNYGYFIMSILITFMPVITLAFTFNLAGYMISLIFF